MILCWPTSFDMYDNVQFFTCFAIESDSNRGHFVHIHLAKNVPLNQSIAAFFHVLHSNSPFVSCSDFITSTVVRLHTRSPHIFHLTCIDICWSYADYNVKPIAAIDPSGRKKMKIFLRYNITIHPSIIGGSLIMCMQCTVNNVSSSKQFKMRTLICFSLSDSCSFGRLLMLFSLFLIEK